MKLSPKPINHIGVCVPDIISAIKWYQNVLGFVLISGPRDIKLDRPNGPQAADVLGPRLRHLRQAHLASGNGVGFELFQPVDPGYEARTEIVEFWRGGFFHICVTDPDVRGLAGTIVESGGQLLSDFWEERLALDGSLMCYCSDPFGNVIEIYSHSYEIMQSHRK
ncbi:MAG: VOC family protein [Roseitalea sp.]|nr:VOC family protein [Roseitalea sp.]MBO6721131.1 VOC family protein [Roseitalea sp.]MBO6744189.1 VOC family protein [Roseitalea sp.]